MWYYYLIGLFLLLGVVGIFVLLALRHNKYYFWRFAKMVPDRNGARKPGKPPQQIFGTQSPKSELSAQESIKSVSSQIQQTPTSYSFEIDEESQEFSLKFDDVELTRGGIRINSFGHQYTSFLDEIDPKNNLKIFPLKIKSVQRNPAQLTDHLGSYTEVLVSWFSSDKDVLILTSFRIYSDPGCVMFRIEFPTGLEKTANETYEEPSLQFPVFRNNSNRSLVFTYDEVNFSEPRSKFVSTSAPILFYNESLETMIFSSTMNFLTSWNTPGKDFEIRMGLEGKLEKYPKGFFHESMLYAGKGISQTFVDWGNILLKYYQKERIAFNADIPLSVLGYWTDAGSHYYYNHKPYANYEECLLAVKQEAERLEIPYGYFQLDSWFYPKDDGTLLWQEIPEYFPNGIREFVEKLQFPLVCHNRWFSSKTPYKEKFKGWVTESHPKKPQRNWDPNAPNQENIRTWSFPTNPEIWNEMMGKARGWGCVTYEQDWLQPQWKFFDYLKEDAYHGRIWLKNMSDAAAAYGLTIQYCMTFPSFYLATLELPNVTHARCADDYNHRKPKRIYIPHFTQTSMLSWALGVWPWKDPFLSTCDPDPETVGFLDPVPNHYEQHPKLELLLQVLSGGPVGNGDKIENLNAELLLQSCREDGLLIKPDRPAFPIDLMFLSHNKPYIVSTYSDILGAKWIYLLQTMIWDHGVSEYYCTLADLGLSGKYVGYDYDEKCLFPITEETHIGKCQEMVLDEYKYYCLAPVLSNGMAFIGLRDKIATMSSQVFTKVMIVGRSLIVEGYYQPRQEFAVLVYIPRKPTSVMLNGQETEFYTWGPHYKTLTIVIRSDEEQFSLSIQ